MLFKRHAQSVFIEIFADLFIGCTGLLTEIRKILLVNESCITQLKSSDSCVIDIYRRLFHNYIYSGFKKKQASRHDVTGIFESGSVT